MTTDLQNAKRSAGSKRGHERRRIRQRLRDELLLRMVDNGGPARFSAATGMDDYKAIAEWVADNLPDRVVDALERAQIKP